MSMDEKTEFARELIERCENDWNGNESLDTLVTHRWAIVTEREGESWVQGIDTLQQIAGRELGCLTGTEGYDEWIEGVYDLETGEAITYKDTVSVVVEREGEVDYSIGTNEDLIPVLLTSEQLELVCAALDSHLYWQLSPPERRNSGYVMEPMTEDERECEGLHDRLEKIPNHEKEVTT